MNNPNPLMPQGSLKELNKGKSHVRIAVFTILAIHVVVIGGLLIAGCKKDTDTAQNPNTTPTNPPPQLSPSPEIGQIPPQELAPPNNIPGTPRLIQLPPEPPAAGPTGEYTIAPGDTFDAVSKKLGIPLKTLLAANPNVDPKKLQVKQKIQVPAKSAETASTVAPGSPKSDQAPGTTEGLYEVQPGDNLTRIATKHGTTIKALRAANNLRTDQIRVHQKLKLPAKAGAATKGSAPVEPIPAGAGAP